ncbi:unnamed protein product, partial [Symbiodinium pilosum]
MWASFSTKQSLLTIKAQAWASDLFLVASLPLSCMCSPRDIATTTSTTTSTTTTAAMLAPWLQRCHGVQISCICELPGFADRGAEAANAAKWRWNKLSLGQPFYKSNVRGWTKLTYNQQNLDCNVKVNGQLTDMSRDVTLDFRNSTYAKASGPLKLSGTPQVQLTRTYSFTGRGLVFKANFHVLALEPVSSVQVWMGTSDDWIGTTDRPTKDQGSFRGGDFVPIPHGRILRVHSGHEDVFVYSTHPDSHAIILSHYGQWGDVL